MARLAVIDTGSCAGCELEIASVLSVCDLGIELVSDQEFKTADILVFTGTITNNFLDEFKQIIQEINKMKNKPVIIAMGICPITGNVFKETSNAPLNKWVAVDITVPGCPPKPPFIRASLEKALNLLQTRRKRYA